MGKYAKLRDKFVRFTEAPDYQSKLDAHKKTSTVRRIDLSFTELQLSKPVQEQEKNVLGKLLAASKAKKKLLEDALSELNAQLAAYQQLLLDQLEGEDLESFRTAEGMFSIKDEPYPFVEDKEKLYAWVDEQDLTDLYTINYQTMAAMVKERLMGGEELPPGVNVFMKTSVNFTKSKSEGE